MSNNIKSIYWTSHFSKTQPVKNTAKKADEWLKFTFQRPVYFYYAFYMNKLWVSGPPMISSNHSVCLWGGKVSQTNLSPRVRSLL